MKLEKRIYCIEGHWDYGEEQVEPSVEPILQMLQKLGQWSYARRDCATQSELEFWLENEWNECCAEGSILYIASHGSEGCIWLGSEDHPVSLHQLAEKGTLNCGRSLVHFGGCQILAGPKGEAAAQDFMMRTGASFVTGYTEEVYWASEQWAPAVALDLILFSSIWELKGFSLTGPKRIKNSVEPMEELINRLKENDIFEKCGLKLFINNEAN